MSEYIHNSQYESKDKKMHMKAADKYFGRIDPNIKNGNILIQIVESEGTSSFIVKRLEAIEKSRNFYWNDKELINWFDNKIKIEEFKAPNDPVDKLRWLALVCITSSLKEGFSYGNVLIPPDVLPEDSKEFKMYEDLYGVSVLEDIISFRDTLKK